MALGNFYETFYQDAEIVGSVTGSTILHMNRKGKCETVLMTGFPYHQLEDNTIALIEQGYQVGIIHLFDMHNDRSDCILTVFDLDGNSETFER